MKRIALMIFVAAGVLTLKSAQAENIELYLDTKTQQVYAAPGAGRIKLGTYAPAPAPVPAPASSASPSGSLGTPPSDQPKIDTNGKFQITSADGRSSFRVGGRLHLDGSIYDNDSRTDYTNAFDARRARLEFQGTMYKDWDWKFDYEFGQVSEVKSGFRDAFVRYRVPGTTSSFTVGQFKEYFGLESLNSSNDLALVERALPSRAFHDIAESGDGRRIGIGWNANDKEQFTLSLGAFGRNVAGDSSDSVGDPFALESRLTFSPVHEERSVIHAGFAANWIDLNDPARGKLGSRPEARLGVSPLIETGEISGAESMTRYGCELGAVQGPLWTQNEYIVATFDRKDGPTPTFTGWYTSAGWVLTGESRHYDFTRGTFSNPKPQSGLDKDGYGAVEAVARLSGLDYTDKDINGGRETNFSLGLNWYPNSNFRFMFTWTEVLDVSGGKMDGQTPDELLLRTQFAF